MMQPAQPGSRTRELFAQAGAALRRRDPRQAGELALQLLQREPDHPEAHYIAGLAALELRALSRAIEHLHRASKAMPGHAPYAVHFARALAAAHHYGDALQVANDVLALASSDPLMLDTLGNIYLRCQAPERAAAAFRRAAAGAPDNPSCRFNFASSLIFTGDIDGAEAELEACIALAPEHWRAHGVLSRIRRQTPASNHIERLLALTPRSGPDPIAKMQLHVALSKEYEDLGDFPRAFDHLVTGKSAIKRASGYRPDRDEALVDALIRRFPEPWPQPAGHPTDEPIFIIGMPRTGTTLVERILASHPEVHAAGELENFGLALERQAGTRSPSMLTPQVISQTSQLDWNQLGGRYLSSTRPATALKPRFVDKYPHNFLYAGFIANALPNARIICLRRNPMDTCLSNLREPFAAVSQFHGYAFDLLDTGRYYILFDRLMAHWRRVMPGRILELDYETLVGSQESSTRQLLEHCDLPWNGACLHFERNPSPSTTASSVQVRAPIHQQAVRRWKNYEGQLGELHQQLTAAGIDCGG